MTSDYTEPDWDSEIPDWPDSPDWSIELPEWDSDSPDWEIDIDWFNSLPEW